MRHRSSDFPAPNDPSGESDEDGISLPKGCKFNAENVESPADEMQRLIRKVGGKRLGGEKDPVLMARAARRMGITIRRARTYWYAQPCIISSEDMDLARELAFVQPIEEAIDAVVAAEQFLDGLRARLLARIAGTSGPAGGRAADRAGTALPLRPDRLSLAGKSRRPSVPSNPPALAGLSSRGLIDG